MIMMLSVIIAVGVGITQLNADIENDYHVS